MKTWPLFVLLFGVSVACGQQQHSAPQQTASHNSATGINFLPGTIEQTLAAARKVNKPVFVEIFSPTCHVCQSFIPTLSDKKAGKFYNASFVSTRLDIMQKSTQAFLTQKKLFVPSLPLFLFFDAQGKLLHTAMSNNTVDDVIVHGNTAMNPATRATTYRQRFDQGDRNSQFLIDYGMFAKITTDTVANILAMNEYAKQQPADQLTSNTNFLVLQKLIMDMDNPLAISLVNHLDQYQAYGNDQGKPRDVAENILMSSLYSGRGGQYPAAKVLQVRDGLVKIGIAEQVANNRTLLPEVNAYFRAKQTAKATARMNEHIAKFSFSVPEYLYISRLFNRSSSDAADVPIVSKWVQDALALKKATPQEQADLYFELAEANRRAGKMADAQKAAQKSMELAQATKMDTRRNIEQISKLK
jgi:thiol-disulfide isomerase/thioredoxin